jgi:hypothetical protein
MLLLLKYLFCGAYRKQRRLHALTARVQARLDALTTEVHSRILAGRSVTGF